MFPYRRPPSTTILSSCAEIVSALDLSIHSFPGVAGLFNLFLLWTLFSYSSCPCFCSFLIFGQEVQRARVTALSLPRILFLSPQTAPGSPLAHPVFFYIFVKPNFQGVPSHHHSSDRRHTLPTDFHFLPGILATNPIYSRTIHYVHDAILLYGYEDAVSTSIDLVLSPINLCLSPSSPSFLHLTKTYCCLYGGGCVVHWSA